MWEQFKKTFVFSQIGITGVAVAVGAGTHNLYAATLVFLIMQLGNIAGLAWGARLRRRMEARTDSLPLTPK